MNNLTALILTYNEQDNIARSLSALQWVNRVIVLDSNSTDDTIDIVRQYPNVTVVQRPFDDHTSQWNFGLDQVGTDWVLALDADYEISAASRDEILGLSPNDQVKGYSAEFQYRIFGRPLRSSVYPPRIILFRRDSGSYVPDGHTQLLKIDDHIEKLKSPVFHDDRKPFTRWLASQDAYAKLEANHLLRAKDSDLKPQDRLRKTIVFAPIAVFFYLMFVRGLILDGWPGWYYVSQRTIAEFLLSIRLLERRTKSEEQSAKS